MKKLNSNFIIAAMAIAMTASCTGKFEQNYTAEEGETNSPATSDLVSMTFSAFNGDEVIDTKTTYRGRDLYWETTDVISVFSVAETVTKTDFTVSLLSDDKKEASFTGMGNPNAQEYYAVYPHAETNAYDNGTFTVNIPTEQVAVEAGFASNTNVSVAVADKEGSFQFKNLSTLIYFKFETPGDAANTKSVTIKARKSEDDAQTQEFFGLTGNVKFTLDEEGIPMISEGSVDHVTLQAPQGGFVAGANYIIPVCSVGECKGLQVIFEDHNGQKYVKNNNIDLKLQRSTIFNHNSVPNPYYSSTLPDSFSIKIDFTQGWPFVSPCLAKDNQTDLGDSYWYIYEYEHQNEKYTLPVESGIYRGGWNDSGKDLDHYYKYEGNKLCFRSYYLSDKTNCTASIKIPVVKDRYLEKVVMVHDSGDSKRYTFNVGFPNDSKGTTQAWVGSNKEFVMGFPVLDYKGAATSITSPVLGQEYSIRTREVDTDVVSMEIFYSKENPNPAQ